MRIPKHILLVIVLYLLGSTVASAAGDPPLRVLFDDIHGQAFGNADWLIHGAFSDFAGDLTEHIPARVTSVKTCSNNHSLDALLPETCDVLVIPEPNLRFASTEISCIRRFVENGGGLMLIADHGGADRNMDGWDAGLIFNELCEPWGLVFPGDTWSETPVRGGAAKGHPVMKHVRRIGAWAAGSILITHPAGPLEALLRARVTGLPYIVAGPAGKGRLLTIGDSSPFDDGTGSDPEKNRHSSYGSWLYDHRRFAVQAVAWLGRRRPRSTPMSSLPFPRTDFPEGIALRQPTLVIDAAHGDSDADRLDRFGRHIRKALHIRIKIALVPFDGMNGWDVLIMPNPTEPLDVKEEKRLIEWVRSGGGLLLTTGNARNLLSGIPIVNHLLERLGSRIRINADEVIDGKFNTGKPWSMVVSNLDGIDFPPGTDAVFWGSASLTDPAGHALQPKPPGLLVTAWTSKYARSRVLTRFKIKGGHPLPPGVPIPVAAAERLEKGRLVVLGADTMTYFQYPTEAEKRCMKRVQWDHSTPKFNLALVKWLLNK